MEIIAFKAANGQYVLHKQDDNGEDVLTLTNSISEALMVTRDALKDDTFLNNVIQKVGQPVVAVDLAIMEKSNFDELFKIRSLSDE
jgi:hypothetical protein